jgi:acyl carrier protein
MEKQKFIDLVAETIQTDAKLKEGTVLRDIEEWDSLAILTLVGLFKKEFQINLNMNMIAGCRTVADLMAMAKGKVEQ